MTQDYPASDFPYTLYFNGHVMPHFAGQWLWALHESFFAPEKAWNEYIDLFYLWRLACRMDHVGVVQSEDPIIFIVCAQALLEGMLINEESVALEIKARSGNAANPAEVFSGIRDGLFEMIQHTTGDGHAFWISGYPEDQKDLADFIKRFHLPPSDPDYTEAPHLTSRRSELNCRRKIQAKELHRLAQEGRFNKEIRRKLHLIPNANTLFICS